MSKPKNERADPLTARGIKLSGDYFADCNLLADIIAKDMEAREQLERKRNELAAQLERFRDSVFGMLVNRTGTDEWYDLEKVYRETPSVALATLKAKYQADIITELQNHMINNGYNNEADGVSTWFKEHQKKQKCTHE